MGGARLRGRAWLRSRPYGRVVFMLTRDLAAKTFPLIYDDEPADFGKMIPHPHRRGQVFRSWICADGLRHYWDLPEGVKKIWVTLTPDNQRRPTVDAVHFKGITQSGAYVENGVTGEYRYECLYNLFSDTLTEVGGLSCWMEVEYK